MKIQLRKGKYVFALPKQKFMSGSQNVRIPNQKQQEKKHLPDEMNYSFLEDFKAYAIYFDDARQLNGCHRFKNSNMMHIRIKNPISIKSAEHVNPDEILSSESRSLRCFLFQWTEKYLLIFV